MLSIQHNMQAWNAQRQFNITSKAKAKKTEKLSSGYRVNRAADDAAGLAISEKMRRQIRGLKAGTENAQHGVSWVQIGEGALNEAHDILHRMNELTIKAQNGTWTEVDREYMEEEFNHLQSELDRISTTTTFNELNIFREHEPTYDQICGNIYWDHEEIHEIMAGRNQLIINYREDADEPQKTITLEVPAGTYTTHELIDELDDAALLLGSPIRMEYNKEGYCSLNLEGGEIIDTITGDLQYLLWDTYNGGGYGALIGTTEFPNATDRLEIVKGQNDHMEFQLEYFDGGNVEWRTIDITPGEYTKEELMNIIKGQVDFANTGLVASDYGDSIMLSSDKGIVTGFKGNMFKIENKDPIYSSVFYDNIQQGYVWQDPAFVVGGAVLTTDTRDKEHNRYYIDSTNNTLVLQPNLTTAPKTITIATNTTDGYTAEQMVEELNKKFAAAGLGGEVKACLVETKSRENFEDKTNPGTSGTLADSANATLVGGKYVESVGDDTVVFQGVEIRTIKEGPDAVVNIDRAASTAYDTLFTIKDFNSYGTDTDATIDNEEKGDGNAYAESSKDYKNNKTVTIKNNVNDKFKITLTSTNNRAVGSASDYNETFTVDIQPSSSSTSMNATDIAKAINTALKSAVNDKTNTTTDLSKRLIAEVVDNKIHIRDNEDATLDNVTDKSMNWNTTVSLSAAGSNTGYRAIFQEEYQYDVEQTKSGKGTLTLNTKNLTLGGGMKITVNGTSYDFDFKGKTKLSDIVAEMKKAKPIKFSYASDSDNMNVKTVMMSGSGKAATETLNYYAGGSADGATVKPQGSAEASANRPAQLTMESALNDPSKLTSGKLEISVAKNNNTITIASKKNGIMVSQTLMIADGAYTEDELVEALQKECDKKFGDGMGGVSVDVENHQLVFTSVLPVGYSGSNTSLSIAGKGGKDNTFFDWLNTVTTEATAASCTSNLAVADSITLKDGENDRFQFTYTDSTGPHDVVLDLSSSAAGETLTRDEFMTRLKQELKNQKNTDGSAIKVEADLSDNRLVLKTTDTGAGTFISYTGISTDPNADAIFGGLSNPSPAQIILDKKVQTNPSFTGTKRFQFTLDNDNTVFVEIAKWSSADDLASKLTAKFNEKNIDVKATIVDGKLCLTKKNANGGNISMSYDSGGNIMEYIFGHEPGNGITVSASGDNLVITAGKNDTITVSSSTSGGTLATKKATAYLPHDAKSGFHSAKYSTVTSNTLDPNGIVLNRWNNDLQFTFKQGDKTTDVSITLSGKPTGPNGETALSDIRDELQDKINAKLGNDAIEVKLENNKLIFQSKKAGSQYQFSGMKSENTSKVGGGFFHHVMCGYTEKTNQLADPADVNGDQRADKIYAQGRHDVVMDLTRLQNGISDTLILDLTYVPDTNHDGKIETDKEQKITLELLLDTKPEPLKFTGDELKTMIQEKLNEAIRNQNNPLFHENMIEVDVGRINNPDIVGNKDSVSLSFNITRDPDLATLEEGFFYIDGIRGNAAYETFYYTEGELIPAYIVGTKNLSNGVVLGENDKELVFEVDGEECTVDLTMFTPGKKYGAKEISDEITEQFKAQGVPLAANITPEGYLRISHQRMGKHVIEKVTGSARDELFFKEHADKQEYKEKYVKLSAADNDRIELYSPIFSTMMLNINSICISGIKYAEKAGERLKEAISKVSGIRSTFGALQNRLEHAINNNQNKEENLQAAESRIRDADIAKEMVDYSNLNIIQQAGQAVLAQANQSSNYILSLLS